MQETLAGRTRPAFHQLWTRVLDISERRSELFMGAYLLHVLCLMSGQKMWSRLSWTQEVTACVPIICGWCTRNVKQNWRVYIFLYYVTPCRLTEIFRPLELKLLPPSSGYKIWQTKQQAVYTMNRSSIGRGGDSIGRGGSTGWSYAHCQNVSLLSVSLKYRDSLYFICQISSPLPLDFAVPKNPSKSEALCNIS
jgi:hypothetical protein